MDNRFITNNNTEFLRFQLSSFREYIKKYKFKDKLAKMGLDEELIGVFRKIHMDDNRKMYLIHGDFQKSNLLEHAGMYYIVDWEHATYGDLAYELARHFILMEYSYEEKEIFINRLCDNISVNIETLKNDIAETCKELPMYKKISDIEIRKEEFEKTTTNKIKR